MPISPDALLGALITVGLAGLVAMWKLATMLAEVRGQVRHNGGDTLKDNARDAARDAAAAREEGVKARELAEKVATDLTAFRGHQAEDTANTVVALGKVQHDLTNIRATQDQLLEQQLVTDGRVDRHKERNEAWAAALAEAVERLERGAEQRDHALGEALQESLDVAIAAAEDTEDHIEG